MDPSAFGFRPSAFVDTHAHLDAEEFEGDRPEVLARAKAAGIAAVICPGLTAASSACAVRLAAEHVAVFAAVGIQPNHAGAASEDDWERIVALIGQPKVVAVGETGLDRYWDYTPWEVQRDYLQRHLRLAQEHDRPVILHARDAEADLLPILREAAGRGRLRGVMHAFSGDCRTMEMCVELGLFISFSGSVTYRNKKFEPMREAARLVPGDRLLIETDSPYLVPEPLRGKQARNEPAHLLLVAQRLAEIRGQRVEELAAQTATNARALFGLSFSQ